MKIRIAAAASLLCLALPLSAQEKPVASEVEAIFYKAYYLEKGQRDFVGAMPLYELFLEKAPKHDLAKEAAAQQFRLLDLTGKTKERDAFKEKYKDLLGNVANASTRPARGEREEGEERGGRGQRGEGFGGRGQRGGGRGGLFSLLRPDVKLADMSEEQIAEIKTGLEQSSEMIERFRERVGDEVADKMTKANTDLKKALDAGNMEEAQKAVDALREAFPMGRGRGGRGGDAGGRGGDAGGRGGRGGEAGGRGGRGGRGGAGGGGGGEGGGGGGI